MDRKLKLTLLAAVLVAGIAATIVMVIGTVRTVPTVADMVGLDPRTWTSNGQGMIRTLGRNYPGDGGGLDFVFTNALPASTATNNGTCFALSTGYAYAPNWDGDIRAFGARPNDDSFDNGPVISEASLYRSQTGGGPILVKEGIWYVATKATIYKGTTVKGLGCTYSEIISGNPSSKFWKADSPSVVWLKSGADCDVFQVSTNGGYLRQTVTLYDGSTVNQYFVHIGFEGFLISGNNQGQTRKDIAAIRAEYAWNLRIHNVAVVDFMEGFHLRKCNAVDVDLCYAVDAYNTGKAALRNDTCGDIQITKNKFFSGRGPRIRNVGLGAHKNTIALNLIGNSVSNAVRQVTSISSGTLTSAGHDLWDGDIIQFTYAGTGVPSGLMTNTTFFVKRLTSDTFKVHTNLVAVQQGTYLTPGSIGGGDGLYFNEGGACGISLEDGARRTSILGNRIDQCEGDGIVLNDATEISINANVLQENGFNTSELAAAIRITGDSYYNSIVANTGADQDYGILIAGDTPRWNTVFANGFSGTPVQYYATTSLGAQRNGYGAVNLADGIFEFGGTNAQKGLRIVGGASAQDIFQLRRPGVVQVGFRGISGGLYLADTTDDNNHQGIGRWYNADTNTTVIRAGLSQHWHPRDLQIWGDAPTSGVNGTTNGAAADVEIWSGFGTGDSTDGGRIAFRTPDPGASGTSEQAQTEKIAIERDGQLGFTGRASDPTVNVANGQIYFNSSTGKLRFRTGGAWVDLN